MTNRVGLTIGETLVISDVAPGIIEVFLNTNDGQTLNVMYRDMEGVFNGNFPFILEPPNFTHRVARIDGLDLDVVVSASVPEDVVFQSPGWHPVFVYDTHIPDPDRPGRTIIKEGELYVQPDKSWKIISDIGTISASGSSGSSVPLPLPLKLNKVCAICGARIPKRAIDDLTDLGYTAIEVKRSGEKREKAFVCPKHSHDEVVKFAGSAMERGKLPKTRAHCIKVRGEKP